MKNTQTALDLATKQVKNLETGRGTIQADLDRATKQVKELESNRERVQADLDRTTSRVRELEDGQPNNLDERVKELETNREKVQTDLDRASKRVKELEEQNRLLQNEKNAAAVTIASMQLAQRELAAKLNKFRWPSDDPPALEQKILGFLNERQEAKNSAAILKTQVKQLEKKLQDQKDELQACRAECSRLKTELANAPQPVPVDAPQPVPAPAPSVTADLEGDLPPDKVDYVMRCIAHTVSKSLPDFKTGCQRLTRLADMQAIDARTQKPVNFRSIERFIYDTGRVKEYDQDHEIQSLMGQFSRKVRIREIQDGQESEEAQNNRADADDSNEEEDSEDEDSEDEDMNG